MGKGGRANQKFDRSGNSENELLHQCQKFIWSNVGAQNTLSNWMGVKSLCFAKRVNSASESLHKCQKFMFS